MRYKLCKNYEIINQDGNYLIINIKDDRVVAINPSAYHFLSLLLKGLTFQESVQELSNRYESIPTHELELDMKTLVSAALKNNIIEDS